MKRGLVSTLQPLAARSQYTTSDTFETFPFPPYFAASKTSANDTTRIGKGSCNPDRRAHQTYNRFHNPEEAAADIERLRELHVEMDRAVADAYGWGDLELEHGFHETKQGVRFTISEEARRRYSTACSFSTTSVTPRKSTGPPRQEVEEG